MKTTKIRILLVALLVLSSVVVLAACAPKAPEPTATPVVTEVPATEVPATEAPATEVPATEIPVTEAPVVMPTEKAALPVFTAEELAKYDGKNGNPAYVAVEGQVYDVTSVPQWANGEHAGKYTAGLELTTEFLSRHGLGTLTIAPVVGTYQATATIN